MSGAEATGLAEPEIPASGPEPVRPGGWRDRVVSGLSRAVRPWDGLLLLGAYLAACWATIVTRVQWGPDSRLYLAWAYRYLGHSPVDAAHRTRDFLFSADGLQTCGDLCWGPGYEHAYFTGPDGAVVGARPLYPLLSAPFVALFGPTGMLVVPVLAYAVVIAGVALLARRLWGRPWDLVAGLLIILPVTVSRWAVMAQTEGLAIALTVVCVLFLPLRRRTRPRDLLWFNVLLVLGLCVRQFALALTAGVVLVALLVALRDRRLRNPWLPFAVSGVLVTGLVLVAQSFVTSHFFNGAVDLPGRYQRLTCSALHHCGVTSVPWGLKYIVRGDYGYIRADLVLLATLGLAFLAVVWRWRSELTALAVGSVLATLALNLLVVWPSYYRYFAPIHPLVLLAALALVADVAAGRHPGRSGDAFGAHVPAGRRPPEAVDRPAPNSLGGRSPRWYGWALAGGAFLGATMVVWRRDRPALYHGSPALFLLAVLALVAAFVLVTLVVVARFGALAGVLAGLAVALSDRVEAAALASWRSAVLLAAGAAALALLPDRKPPASTPVTLPDRLAALGLGAPLAGTRARPVGLGLLAALAVAVSPVGLALVGGVLAGALGAAIGSRRARSPWAPCAMAALVGGGLAVVARWAVTGRPLGGWHAVPLNRLVSADFRAVAPDRVLYLTLLLAVVAVLVRWREPVSWYAAGAALSTGVLHLGHRVPAGVPDLLAVYPALLLAVVALLSGATRLGRTGRAIDERLTGPPSAPQETGVR